MGGAGCWSPSLCKEGEEGRSEYILYVQETSDAPFWGGASQEGGNTPILALAAVAEDAGDLPLQGDAFHEAQDAQDEDEEEDEDEEDGDGGGAATCMEKYGKCVRRGTRTGGRHRATTPHTDRAPEPWDRYPRCRHRRTCRSPGAPNRAHSDNSCYYYTPGGGGTGTQDRQ